MRIAGRAGRLRAPPGVLTVERMKAILCAALAIVSVAACQTGTARSGPLFQTAGIPGASAPPGAESGPNTGLPTNPPVAIPGQSNTLPGQPNTGTFGTAPITLGSSDFLDGGSVLGTGGSGTAGTATTLPSSSGTMGDLGALDGGSFLGTGGSGAGVGNTGTIDQRGNVNLGTTGSELGVDAGSF